MYLDRFKAFTTLAEATADQKFEFLFYAFVVLIVFVGFGSFREKRRNDKRQRLEEDKN